MLNPLENPDGAKVKILNIVDTCLTIVFCIETLIKIIAFGMLFNGRQSYLRNAWNILDFFIVMLSVNLTPTIIIVIIMELI